MTDSKTLNHRIAVAIGESPRMVSAMLEAFERAIVESSESLSTIAIPSFGSFVTIKQDEEIRKDLSSGKNMIYPPQISLEFRPATSLRKKVLDNHG